VTVCRTIADVEAQADADSLNDPPLSQETADKVAAILAAGRGTRYAGRALADVVVSELQAPQ
jgi:hypothetical protein